MLYSDSPTSSDSGIHSFWKSAHPFFYIIACTVAFLMCIIVLAIRPSGGATTTTTTSVQVVLGEPGKNKTVYDNDTSVQFPAFSILGAECDDITGACYAKGKTIFQCYTKMDCIDKIEEAWRLFGNNVTWIVLSPHYT
jgi:hypothetical protein